MVADGPADDLADQLAEDLAEAVADLRRIAAAALAGERPGHTLQPTALVNEFYLKLATAKGYDRLQFPTRDHLLAYASDAIGNILIDHARGRNAKKRGGGSRPAGLDGRDVPDTLVDFDAGERAVRVAELLARLENEHPISARVAKLRYFGGMTDRAIANVLGVTDRSVSTYWRAARAWLTAELADYGPR